MKLTDLSKKVSQLSIKGYDFLLGRMHFTDDGIYQNFLVIAHQCLIHSHWIVIKMLLTGY